VKRTIKSAPDAFAAANLTAASIIASDPVTHPVGSLMAEWAEVILTRAAEALAEGSAPLFSTQEAA
jgi:hypothetical protein